MLGLVNRPNDISLSKANQSQAKFKSAVGGNLLQSWVNLTVVFFMNFDVLLYIHHVITQWRMGTVSKNNSFQLDLQCHGSWKVCFIWQCQWFVYIRMNFVLHVLGKFIFSYFVSASWCVVSNSLLSDYGERYCFNIST